MGGIFTISLDFELHWGGFEKWQLGGSAQAVRDERGRQVSGNALQASGVRSSYRQYFLNTRLVIPEMLKAFQQHETHVTWATVGFLFHETRAELMANMPFLKPSLAAKELSAYQYIDQVGIGESEAEDPFHYGLSLIRQIKNTPYQEIGSHTFAHYYACEEGQSGDQFRADLQAAQRAAHKQGIVLKSLVFPRNQVNEDYLTICAEEGFRCIRTNPTDWFWHIESTQSESLWKRLNRGLDAYFKTGKRKSYTLESVAVAGNAPLRFPASRLLRPYSPRQLFLNRLKINRIIAEMEEAARAGEVYHLWWHPHNFGNYPQESMAGLMRILKHYQYLKQHYGMESCTMSELTDRLTTTEQATRSA